MSGGVGGVCCYSPRPWGRERGVGGWVMARIASGEGIDGCPVNYRKEEKADVSGIARWEAEGAARRIY